MIGYIEMMHNEVGRMQEQIYSKVGGEGTSFENCV